MIKMAVVAVMLALLSACSTRDSGADLWRAVQANERGR